MHVDHLDEIERTLAVRIFVGAHAVDNLCRYAGVACAGDRGGRIHHAERPSRDGGPDTALIQDRADSRQCNLLIGHAIVKPQLAGEPNGVNLLLRISGMIAKANDLCLERRLERIILPAKKRTPVNCRSLISKSQIQQYQKKRNQPLINADLR